LSEDIDNIKRMEDAGASAVVLYSLFEEQLRQDRAELRIISSKAPKASPKRSRISPSRNHFISARRNISSTSPGPKKQRASRSSPA
jgi:dihydroorotate dehydrogenase (fumarate)